MVFGFLLHGAICSGHLQRAPPAVAPARDEKLDALDHYISDGCERATMRGVGGGTGGAEGLGGIFLAWEGERGGLSLVEAIQKAHDF